VREALSAHEWLITESGFDLARAAVYETLCTVGNGYLGTRGTLEEGHPGDLSGTYLNGVYDDHDSPVIDLVNAPDWLGFAVHVDGTRLDVRNCTVLEHERTLHLQTGSVHNTASVSSNSSSARAAMLA
jgi:kojibiose phosphorylase